MRRAGRITRAQSMDILSSMATVAGYKAVLLAAETLPSDMLYLTENHQIILCFEYGTLTQIAAIGRHQIRTGICGTD